MKQFYRLVLDIQKSLSSEEKGQSLLNYLEKSASSERLFGLAIILGKKNKKYIANDTLKRWFVEISGFPEWLIDNCLAVSGDLSETISLIKCSTNQTPKELSVIELGAIFDKFSALKTDSIKDFFENIWQNYSKETIFIVVKLLTGGFNFSINNNIVVDVLNKFTGLSPIHLALKINEPFADLNRDFDSFFFDFDPKKNKSQPYPFKSFLKIEEKLLKNLSNKKIELEQVYQGIRCQIICRGDCVIWSEENELITHFFPEFEGINKSFPDGVVLEGWLVPFENQKFVQTDLRQERLNKKSLKYKKSTAASIVFMASDILENEYLDVRSLLFLERRKLLEKLVLESENDLIRINEIFEKGLDNDIKKQVEPFKYFFLEGFIVRESGGAVESKDTENKLLFWKLLPRQINAVLLYATKGNGKDEHDFVDFTFALLENGQFIPITKAINNLDIECQNEINNFILKNTIEKFGPVRSVVPNQVFKLSFESILPSKRHKSGLVLKNPILVKWLRNESVENATSLAELKQLLN
jgi:DNA ligase-1